MNYEKYKSIMKDAQAGLKNAGVALCDLGDNSNEIRTALQNIETAMLIIDHRLIFKEKEDQARKIEEIEKTSSALHKLIDQIKDLGFNVDYNDVYRIR